MEKRPTASLKGTHYVLLAVFAIIYLLWLIMLGVLPITIQSPDRMIEDIPVTPIDASREEYPRYDKESCVASIVSTLPSSNIVQAGEEVTFSVEQQGDCNLSSYSMTGNKMIFKDLLSQNADAGVLEASLPRVPITKGIVCVFTPDPYITITVSVLDKNEYHVLFKEFTFKVVGNTTRESSLCEIARK